MYLKIIYEDDDILTIDKPAGLIVFNEGEGRPDKEEKTLIDLLLKNNIRLKNVGRSPRYGIVHRLDKDTSGVILVAKNNKTLGFLQGQFQAGKVIKKYLALVAGNLGKKDGKIETLIGRSPKDRRKQKVFLFNEPGSQKKRAAITEYKVLEKFQNYDLIEVVIKTGRKHQIRTHFSHFGHPIAGDKLYGFKKQSVPEGLKRQFLHANYLRIKVPDKKIKEFYSELPEDLKKVLKNLNPN